MWSTADGAVKPEVARRLGGQLLHEESRLEHRKQLGHLPGSPRARGLHLGHRSFECDPPLPPDGEEISGARRAIETIQNVFRHSLGTCFTSVTQPRSQLLRVGHASHRDEGVSARGHCETAVFCTHYREVRPSRTATPCVEKFTTYTPPAPPRNTLFLIDLRCVHINRAVFTANIRHRRR